MKKNIFIILGIIGVIIISILSFVLPNKPFEIIPSYTFISCDKPLYLSLIISCSFMYLSFLYFIYDKINNR